MCVFSLIKVYRERFKEISSEIGIEALLTQAFDFIRAVVNVVRRCRRRNAVSVQETRSRGSGTLPPRESLAFPGHLVPCSRTVSRCRILGRILKVV